MLMPCLALEGQALLTTLAAADVLTRNVCTFSHRCRPYRQTPSTVFVDGVTHILKSFEIADRAHNCPGSRAVGQTFLGPPSFSARSQISGRQTQKNPNFSAHNISPVK